MANKSINIFCTIACAFASTACMQELVDKNYTPTVAGYTRQADESTIFAVSNRAPTQNTVPVLFTDPYATGRNIGNTASPVAPPPVQQASMPSYNSPYGSLGYAAPGTFNNGAIMQNNLPYYQQPVMGANGYYPANSQ